MLPTQNEIETIYKKIWGATAPPKSFKTSEGVWGWEVVVLGYGPYQPANKPWRPLGIPNNPPLRWWRRCWSLQHQNVVDFRWIHRPLAKWWNNWRLSLAFLNFFLAITFYYTWNFLTIFTSELALRTQKSWISTFDLLANLEHFK